MSGFEEFLTIAGLILVIIVYVIMLLSSLSQR